VVGRLAVTLGIFLLVRSPAQAWRVLALQAGAAIVVTAVIAGKMYRTVAFRRLALAPAIAAFKAGWTIFLSSSAVSLYTMANTFILGFFTTSAGVAYYGGAERLVIAVIGLMSPITQALYPRMSHLAVNNREKASGAIRKALIFFGLMGLLAGGALFVAAPWIIRLVLGRAYGPAIPVLRVSSIAVPVCAVSNILGIQWMLPFGMDRAFNRIVVSAGILNVVLAVVLSRSLGPVGTALSVLTSQTFVSICMLIALLRSRGNEPRPSDVQFAQSTHL
jgi:PST family polysaccharide transporter